MRVSYSELLDILFRALTRTGFTRERATRCAALFAEASRDGVYTHGLNRFPHFITTIRNGVVDVDAAAIEASGRLLPIGFWKGSGLWIVLDLAGALLSGGNATWQVPADPSKETGLS